jgi:S-adenosylmethionine synthetase
MELTVGAAREPPVEALEVEVVERKGLGHPDSICDRLAEHLSRSLSRHYLDHFGLVLHHNVDVALRLAARTGCRACGSFRSLQTRTLERILRGNVVGRSGRRCSRTLIAPDRADTRKE